MAAQRALDHVGKEQAFAHLVEAEALLQAELLVVVERQVAPEIGKRGQQRRW
jgi:hypothetical protein